MNSLEDVPFQTPLGSLEQPMKELELVMAPDVTIPDYLQILRDTEYEFTLENWVLTRLQGTYCKGAQPVRQTPRCGESPSCPPYRVTLTNPQEGHCSRRESGAMWAPTPCTRSHSLSSADTRCPRQRTVTFLASDSKAEDGYSGDNEGSSTDDTSHPPESREQPWSTAPKDCGPSTHHSKPVPPLILKSSPAYLDCRPRSVLEQHRSQQASPHHCGQKPSKGYRSLNSTTRKYSLHTQPATPAPSRLQQPRPSSAGPTVKSCRQKTGGGHGIFFDSSAELLSALSQEERELLEAITEKGYPLRTAILALQKTGYRSPEKILSFLVTRNHLCELGYDEAHVEEAMEMFQNCESKATEFLRLLAQFEEMGFRQSAIKEALLVHENHRERALEDLMMHPA